MPVLDLQRFAGGLRPVEAHTCHQTRSLRLAAADGRSYQFRSVDEDPTAIRATDAAEVARSGGAGMVIGILSTTDVLAAEG